MSRKKNVLLSLLLAIVGFILIPAIGIYAADPCHIFHKPFNNILPHGFSPVTRCQYAGLINSYLSDSREGYNSIIIGSSLSTNFRPEYSPPNINYKTIKLATGDEKPVEQAILFQRAITTNNLQHVYWEIFPYLYRMLPTYYFSNIDTLDTLPAYLYNNGKWDDYRYIFNLSTLKDSVAIFLGFFDGTNDINRIEYWENECEKTGVCNQFYSADSIKNIKNNYQPTHRTLKTPEQVAAISYSTFDALTLPSILKYCNDNIQFDLFFPPLSLLWFSHLSDSDFDHDLYLLHHVVEKTAHCANVRVFAFMNETWITADLSNYHDPKHFYGNIHDFLMDAMASGRDQVTPETVSDVEQQLIKNVNTYRPYGTIMRPH
jgi:hypothetical protein